MSSDEMLKDLKQIVGPDNVLTEKCDLLTYSRDRYSPLFSPHLLKIPLAVVFPSTTDEVKRIVEAANKHLIPLVPRGRGTSFSGSATPIVENSVVVDLTKMNKVIYLDEDALHVKVQAGISLKDLEETLNRKGFTFPHDPGSFPSATVGGSISTNALGWKVGKYGLLKDLILGLQVVLPNGTVIETRSMPKSSTGFDIKSLFIGAEGTLGIITEATLRIFPMPEKRIILFYAFPSFEDALHALIKIRKRGLYPAIQLVTDEAGVEEFVEKGKIGREYRGGLILVYEGLEGEVEVQKMETLKVLKAEKCIDLGEDAAKSFWELRHNMYSLMNKEGQYDSLDTAVPLNKAIEFYKYLKEWAEKYKIKNLGISSWVFSENVSMDLVFDSSSDISIREYLKARDEAVIKALELGGTSSYCVGVGIRYAHLMREEHGVAFDIMRAIKRALDPNNIMNPGKMGF
ncbi:MAG: FAD-binding oxidoreductase [archaeon YNP-LCB-003-016]|uniref:FAD-binding oxidoreductase n=1 Tax=Candidatus Culexarchaeum yellowstonense TaxID=2928963 RepID=UPI0026EC4A44|nr:FAD-binding oxidoreductase [Candidatus Culexarchaeum yellowstonense]MCR6691470.1 FAD-binding oxidoreductase [Candidatus Culexarchaeum yellowstonense]